ncbi:MAG: trypsin-like serine protease [Methylomonas sp.]|jgi:hypothetical protein
MNNKNAIADSVVSVWSNDRDLVGSAFAISPNLILTAKHVVKDLKTDQEYPNLSLKLLNGINDLPLSTAATIHCNPKCDIALIELKDKIFDKRYYSTLELSNSNWKDKSIQVFGIDRDTKNRYCSSDYRVGALQGGAGYLFDHKVKKGFSGGAVALYTQDKVIGVISMRHEDDQQTLFVPVYYFKDWLQEFGYQPNQHEVLCQLGISDNKIVPNPENDADEQHKKYLAELPERIKKLLFEIDKSALFQKLASVFMPRGVEQTPGNLWKGFENEIIKDPINLLEQYRNIVGAVLKNEVKQINAAQSLFLLFLGFFSKPGDIPVVNLVYRLPVRTRLAVEIYLAARFGLTPDLFYDLKEGVIVHQAARGQYAIDGEDMFREVGWDPKANANEIAYATDIAVNKVHESMYGQKPVEKLDEFAWDVLNETIYTRRQGDSPQLIRVEFPQKSSSEHHPLHNNKVCAALREILPNLPLVSYGTDSAKIEPKLCAQVNEFFSMLKQYN